MINKDYLYTKIWEDLSTVMLTKGALYLYACDPEDRSRHCATILSANNQDINFVELGIDNQDQMIIRHSNEVISLSSPASVNTFFAAYNPTIIYIEVTGMSCRLAAPLMKYAIENKRDVRVVYSEPHGYLLDEFKNEGVDHDLSESFDGVNPLPGFAVVLPHRVEPIFVTMLGFEGGRLKYLITTQQPSYEKIRPVVGVPGYRVEYPMETYWGNRNSLKTTKAWEHMEYAEANSIVDSYLTLKKISYDNRNPDMVVAPIGTKPHAIGAILYAIKNPSKVELLYDNPKRSVHRTHGIGKVLVCNVTKLFNEN